MYLFGSIYIQISGIIMALAYFLGLISFTHERYKEQVAEKQHILMESFTAQQPNLDKATHLILLTEKEFSQNSQVAQLPDYEPLIVRYDQLLVDIPIPRTDKAISDFSPGKLFCRPPPFC